MNNFIDWEKLSTLSQGNEDIQISLEQKIVKLFEEGGELAQAVLHNTGARNVSASAGNTREAVLEEACDTINVVLDIIISQGFSEEECRAMFSKKLDKWETKVKKFQPREPKDFPQEDFSFNKPQSWFKKIANLFP